VLEKQSEILRLQLGVENECKIKHDNKLPAKVEDTLSEVVCFYLFLLLIMLFKKRKKWKT
jgi:hypothetical protein